jgi:hypothetical protein
LENFYGKEFQGISIIDCDVWNSNYLKFFNSIFDFKASVLSSNGQGHADRILI